MDKDKLDKTYVNSLIRQYDCKYCLGGDTCVIDNSFRCDINNLNEKCPHYIAEEAKR